MIEVPTVPVIQHELPRTNVRGMGALVNRLIGGEVPAFIVPWPKNRTATTDRAYDRHGYVVDGLITVTKKIYPELDIDFDTVPLFTLSQAEVGPLHHDLSASLYEDPLNARIMPTVHTTLSGGGNVRLAHLGTDLEQSANYGFDDAAAYEMDNPNHPHSLLLNNLVNPQITNPNVYDGYLRMGDSVIFAVQGRHSPWHRFDTDQNLEKRTFMVTDIIGTCHRHAEQSN